MEVNDSKVLCKHQIALWKILTKVETFPSNFMYKVDL